MDRSIDDPEDLISEALDLGGRGGRAWHVGSGDATRRRMAERFPIADLGVQDGKSVAGRHLGHVRGKTGVRLTPVHHQASFQRLVDPRDVRDGLADCHPRPGSGGDGITGTRARSATRSALWETGESAEGGQSTTTKSKTSMNSRWMRPSVAAKPATAAGKGRSSGAAAAHRVAVAWGSASATMTRAPRRASSPARCMAKVVFPGPPFWLTRAMMRAVRIVIMVYTIVTVQTNRNGIDYYNLKALQGLTSRCGIKGLAVAVATLEQRH